MDVYKFEASTPTLEPYEEFLLSIVLVLVVVGLIVIAYYNLALLFRGHPPFKICEFFPQVLFPRGAKGLGKHNFEEETDAGYQPLSSAKLSS